MRLADNSYMPLRGLIWTLNLLRVTTWDKFWKHSDHLNLLTIDDVHRYIRKYRET